LRRCIGVWLGLGEYLSFLPGSKMVTSRCSGLLRSCLLYEKVTYVYLKQGCIGDLVCVARVLPIFLKEKLGAASMQTGGRFVYAPPSANVCPYGLRGDQFLHSKSLIHQLGSHSGLAPNRAGVPPASSPTPPQQKWRSSRG